jgi:Tol biopolymer transport system component
MILKQLIRGFVGALAAFTLVIPLAADPADTAPGKLLFTDIYFPALIDSGKHIAYFKIIEEDNVGYSRLCVGDPETGKEQIVLPDIDFNRDKVQAFAFTPDCKYVALVDKNLTLCDIWLHDRNDLYAEPIRLTNLEQFSPGYTTDQLYQLGMNPKAVMEVKQLDFSPDGTKIIMTLGIIGKTALWMYEIDRDHYRQMTPDRRGYLAKWFPDSKDFVFTMTDSLSGKFSEDIWIMEARTNKWRTLVTGTNSESYATPSPDGRYVGYLEYANGTWSPRVIRVSDGKIGRVFDLSYGNSCSSIIWNGDGTKLYIGIAGLEGMFPALYEVPFDTGIFD